MSGSVLRTATSPARQKRSAWSAPHNSKAGSAPWRARRSSWAATAMGPSGPWFQDANLRALSGRTCPRPDQAFLQRLIYYGIATGYLRGRTVQRTSG